MDDARPLVVAVTLDLEIRRALSEMLGEFGASVLCPPSLADLAGCGWDVALLDETHPEVRRETIAQLRGAETDRLVLWLTPDPRGGGAASALAAGADDTLSLPLWLPEARARIAKHLELKRLRRRMREGEEFVAGSGVRLTAYAARLQASHINLRDLCAELEAHNRDLQTLLTAQVALMPPQFPAETALRLQTGLRELFPGAEVRAQVFDRVEPGDAPARKVETADGGRHWTRAALPLARGPRVVGVLEVAAQDGQAFDQHRLALLDTYADQAAQVLSRSLLHEALSVGKAEWEGIVDALADGIFIIGRDFVVRRVNRSLASEVGRSPRDLVGPQCFEAVGERAAPCPDCPAIEAFAGEAETRVRKKRIGDRVHDYCSSPLRDQGGTVYAAVVYARSGASARGHATRDPDRSEALTTVGQLAAGIASEISNPLTAISSYAQLLNLEPENTKLVEGVRRIQQATERIHRLVRDLTAFVGPSDEAFYPLDLNQIASAEVSFSRQEMTLGDTRLREEFQTPLPLVLGAKEQLENVLRNLLSNARDAVAGRGMITVRTRGNGDRVTLEVEDDGIGIPPKDLERVCEPFFTTKPLGKGAGLGLFLAAGVAKKHQGDLTIESEPGRGTRVTLTVPAFSP